MGMAARTRTIVVAGDVTVDWVFVNPLGAALDAVDFAWAFGEHAGVRLVGAAGAATRLAALLERAAPAGTRIVGPQPPDGVLASPNDHRVTQTFSVTTPLPGTVKGGGMTWRVDRYLGLYLANDVKTFLPEVPARPDLLVIADNALNFRGAEAAWRPLLESKPGEILLSTLHPLTENPLLDVCLRDYAERLTVVTTVNDLRQSGANVARALSWEQVAEQTAAAVKELPLAAASRVVVTIGLEGALVLQRRRPPLLVFDPAGQEGEWLTARPGVMGGYHLGLLAALAFAGRATADAVSRGIAAGRALHTEGFQLGGPDLEVGFPFEAVAAALKATDHPFATTTYPAPGHRSILTQAVDPAALSAAAVEVVVSGPEHLPAAIPLETIGAWSSIDRAEIETMRGVVQIMGEYVRHYRRGEPLERPLSLAVFGPPGAGKSFAVKQIAKRLLPGGSRTLEFNLSQFESADELPAAFHQVRDAVLEQYLPLVFWDEFDTALRGGRLGWLRHFLAPMQDGCFREAGTFHPLGPAVFVFAGGTAATLDEFVQAGDEAEGKAAKRPDFVSRLRGYVNVLGPNPVDQDDAAHVLRRALLLRSLLLRKTPQLAERVDGGVRLRVDPSVVRAFVNVSRFLHGARSLEALIDMSSLGGALRFERSALPTRRQLALHLDPDEFLALLTARS
jgi:hypothetical protein